MNRLFAAVAWLAMSGSMATLAQEETEAAPDEPTTLRVDPFTVLSTGTFKSPSTSSAGDLKVVIDLRYPYEGTYDELGRLRASGIAYVNIPTSSSSIRDSVVEKLADTLAKHRGEQVVIHDSNGHRAATLWAAYLVRNGHGLEQALASVDAILPAAQLRPKLERYADSLPPFDDAHRADDKAAPSAEHAAEQTEG